MVLDKNANRENESGVAKYIRTLHETTVELQQFSVNYPDVDMNTFIESFSKKMASFDGDIAMDHHFFSEHLHNFINMSLYNLRLAFANFVYIFNPEKSASMLKKLKEKGPDQLGLRNDQAEAMLLLDKLKTPPASNEYIDGERQPRP